MEHDTRLSPQTTAHGEWPVNESFLDSRHWKRLATAETLTEFAQAWLGLLAAQLPGASRALLIRRTGEEALQTVAAWPIQEQNPQSFAEIATLAWTQRKGMVTAIDDKSQQSSYLAAYPLQVNEGDEWAIVIKWSGARDNDPRAVMRRLQWSVPGLESYFWRGAANPPLPPVAASHAAESALLDWLAPIAREPHFAAACYLAAHALADHCKLWRVAIGFVDRAGKVCITALSDAPQFDDKSAIVKQIVDAMNEAYALPPGSPGGLLPCHEQLGRAHQSIVISLALTDGERRQGILLLEHPATTKITPSTVSVLERLTGLLGPLLYGKRLQERSSWEQWQDATRARSQRLLGKGHVADKLRWSVAILALAVVLFAEGEFRVTADARLEGAVQRAITAPIDGFIDTAWVRAGDVVKTGDPLFQLDNRELLLERDKWRSQHEQYQRQYRDALAQREKSKLRVLSAQLGQAEAHVALYEAQIARVLGRAPFDGVVVSGDLSQSLQAPVARGDVLFQLAPLDDYRLVLEVDERDIAAVATGQRGSVLLASGAGETLRMTVEKLTPVAESRDGKNFFRVEARLAEASPALRPGMKGVAKIDIGPRRLLWIWSRTLLDALRLWWWRWF